MQIIKRDFKGITKLKPQSLDDLWAMKHVLEEGDIIGTRTLRTIQVDKREKKPTFLKIRLEKIEFDDSGNLRLGGEIVEAPEKFARGFHAFTLTPLDVISIEKEKWKDAQKRKLKESEAYRTLQFLICVLDEREADFALATELKLKEIASIKNPAAGKRYSGKEAEAGMGQFFKSISDLMKEHLAKVDKIIIAGPGFTKDNLFEKLPGEIKAKSVLEGASVTGITGLNEVIKRGALDKIASGTRLSKETDLIEKFLVLLAKEGLVTYGIKEVESAAEAGAIEMLLVSDKLVRDEKIEKLMENVEQMKGAVYIINSTHDAGNRLFLLGGIAAFLRYRI